MEEIATHAVYNYSIGVGGDDVDGGGGRDQTKVKAAHISVYFCPSDVTSQVVTSIQPREGHDDSTNLPSPLTSYVFNSGRKWGTGGNDYFTRSLQKRNIALAGPFTAGSRTKTKDVVDGLSHTFFAGEACQNDLATPAQVKYLAGWYDDPVTSGIAVTQKRVHAQWLEGDFHAMRSTEFGAFTSIRECVDQIGFTGGQSGTECRYFFGATHPEVIVMVYGDASVHAVSTYINVDVWRAAGTMAGKENAGRIN